MAAAARPARANVKHIAAALRASEEPGPQVDLSSYSYDVEGDVVARNLMARPSWPARLEACRQEDLRVAAETAALVPTDWAGLAGRYAVNAMCAVIVAVPMSMALWAVAVVMMGMN